MFRERSTRITSSEFEKFLLEEKSIILFDGMNFKASFQEIFNVHFTNDISRDQKKSPVDFDLTNFEFEVLRMLIEYRSMCMEKFAAESKIYFVFKEFGTPDIWGRFVKLFERVLIEKHQVQEHILVIAKSDRVKDRFIFDAERDDRVLILLSYHFHKIIRSGSSFKNISIISNDKFRSFPNICNRKNTVTIIDRWSISHEPATFSIPIPEKPEEVLNLINKIRLSFSFVIKQTIHVCFF